MHGCQTDFRFWLYYWKRLPNVLWIEWLLLCAVSVNNVPLWALKAADLRLRWWIIGYDFYLVAFHCTYLKTQGYTYKYTISNKFSYMLFFFLVVLYLDDTKAEQVCFFCQVNVKNIKWNKRQQSFPFAPQMFASAQTSVSWVHVCMVSYEWSIVFFVTYVHIFIAMPWKLLTRRVMFNKAPLQNSCSSLCFNADTEIDWVNWRTQSVP